MSGQLNIIALTLLLLSEMLQTYFAYEYLNFVGNGFESLGSLLFEYWVSPAVSNAVYGIILLAILV